MKSELCIKESQSIYKTYIRLLSVLCKREMIMWSFRYRGHKNILCFCSSFLTLAASAVNNTDIVNNNHLSFNGELLLEKHFHFVSSSELIFPCVFLTCIHTHTQTQKHTHTQTHTHTPTHTHTVNHQFSFIIYSFSRYHLKIFLSRKLSFIT
jgi:hypothetical protein